jgi:hypothetical protein
MAFRRELFSFNKLLTRYATSYASFLLGAFCDSAIKPRSVFIGRGFNNYNNGGYNL